VKAIREVAAGGSAVDPAIAERLSGRRETGEHDRELLELMSQGLGYEAMAERLGTTQEAVDGRVTGLFTRMAAGATTGGASAVDEMKRLHAAVVAKQAAAATLSSYMPQRVAEKLAAGEVGQEELEVTVLFSDIRGFSTIAERLSAREIAEIVGRHFTAMAEIVVEHGGTIDKFQGDSVMVVFGAPDPLLDHAARALRCAIAMQARQAELNAEGWGTQAVDGLHIGVGINSGLVIAGAVGGGGRLEYTVIGDAVNVAQRLQSEAAGGEIVASASTIAAADDVDALPIGLRQVKGREEPVEVYRVRNKGEDR
jgi:class 3 adenylate cyclase